MKIGDRVRVRDTSTSNWKGYEGHITLKRGAHEAFDWEVDFMRSERNFRRVPFLERELELLPVTVGQFREAVESRAKEKGITDDYEGVVSWLFGWNPKYGVSTMSAVEVYRALREEAGCQKEALDDVTRDLGLIAPAREWKVGDIVPGYTKVGKRWHGRMTKPGQDVYYEFQTFETAEFSSYDRIILWIDNGKEN